MSVNVAAGRAKKSSIAHNKPKTASALLVVSNIMIAVAFVCMSIAILLALANMRTMYVVSNSMVPTFQKGDMLIVSENYNSISPGDIIAYDADWADGKRVTHRVVKVEGDTITARGDNNGTSDPPFSKSKVRAEIVSIVPKAGWLFNIYAITGLSSLGLILSFLSDWLKPLPRHAAPRDSFFLKYFRKSSKKPVDVEEADAENSEGSKVEVNSEI